MSEQPLTREALQARFRRGTDSAAQADRPAPASQAPAARPSGSFAKANKYPGTCPHCGGTVEVGAGTVRSQDGKWVTEHKDGQCPLPDASAPAPRIQAKTGQVFTGPLLPGIYTMEDNRGGHVTYRIRVQGSEEDFAPGETIIEFLSGPDNTSDYTSFAFVKPGPRLVVWKRYRDEGHRYQVGGAEALLRDPSRAQVSRNCIRCNATLTTPESIAAGIGPTCAGKGW